MKHIAQYAYSASLTTGLSYELMLSQAALETGWGQRVISGTNNIFNIKADSSWTGDTVTKDVKETINGQQVIETSKFRVYDSVEDAFIDRVKFLKENSRYSNLFSDDVLGNFEKEAQVLQDNKYATDEEYAKKLEDVFEGRTMKKALDSLTFDNQTNNENNPNDLPPITSGGDDTSNDNSIIPINITDSIITNTYEG